MFVIPLKMMGPRTLSFCNTLSFRKIRKYRVRGPSHIGLPPGNPKEICALMMPLKAYTKGRPRISRHLHRDMHPYWERISRIAGAYLPSPLGLCQSRRCLRLHRQKGKVEEQISLWRIVVLCAETSIKPRLCARSLQYMLCMASSVRRGVSPATSLRTGSISGAAVSDGLPLQILR